MSKIRAATFLAIILALALPVLAFGCGGDDPGATVEEFVRASAALDCDTLVSLMSDESVKLFGEDRDKAVEGCKQNMSTFQGEESKIEITSFEVLEESVDGDSAKVKFKVSAKIAGEEQTDEDEVNLVKEGGEWKINVI